MSTCADLYVCYFSVLLILPIFACLNVFHSISLPPVLDSHSELTLFGSAERSEVEPEESVNGGRIVLEGEILNERASFLRYKSTIPRRKLYCDNLL